MGRGGGGRGARRTASRRALAAFMVKEMRHILRDRQTLTILLLMPLVQVLLFGFCLRTEVRGIRVLVVDPSPSAASLALRHRIAATPLFRLVGVLPATGGLQRWFASGAADQALVLEPGFGGRLAHGGTARVLVITDAADPNTASTMQAYATQVIAAYERDERGAAGGVTIVPQVRMRFNPTLRSVNLFVPGLIGMVLTLVSALMTAISLSREKERGTMEVLLVSPLRPWQIVVGKVLPYMALGFANVLTALAAAWWVFRIPFRGSLLLLLAESLLYILVSLALGVLIASRTGSQRVAMLGALSGLMMPTSILSGMIFPTASLPGWLRPVTAVIPARWYILIARGIMLKGVGLGHLWRETLALAGLTVLLLAVSARSFKIRLE